MPVPETRVFIVNSAGHDFTAANVYGKIIPILKGNVNIRHPDRMCYNIFNTLKQYNYTENDYLLLSGNAFSNVITSLSIVNKFRVGILRFLIYDAVNGTYIPQKFNIRSMRFEKDEIVPKGDVIKEINQTLDPATVIADVVQDLIAKENK